MTAEPPDVPWPALGTEAYAEAAGEYLLPALDEPHNATLDELCAASRSQTPLATLRGLCGLLPGENGRGEPVWVGADPTNRHLAGERHVKIGHGGYYGDVPPVRGVYQGGATSRLDDQRPDHAPGPAGRRPRLSARQARAAAAPCRAAGHARLTGRPACAGRFSVLLPSRSAEWPAETCVSL
ncbi:MAG: hypothetical protein QOG94_1352 [Solirubrobacteraceae bacterium]|nr:hypothetical protein [Solirubrobacteraceae bacterium]